MLDNEEQRITETDRKTSAEKRREMIMKELSKITDLEMLESVFWFVRGTVDIEHRRKEIKKDVHMRKMRM